MTEQKNRHPLAEEWLVDYAAGNLSPAYAAVAECYLDLNADHQAGVQAIESLGGAMLDAMDGSTALAISAADLLSRDSAPVVDEPQAAACPDYIPASLRGKFDLERKGINWTFLGPGLRKALLWKGDNDDRLWLLKAEPGVAIPQHTHQGPELTLVLNGAIKDGDDVFGVGDVEEADHDLLHTIQIISDETCICLAATKSRLVFPAPHIKLMQAFLDI